MERLRMRRAVSAVPSFIPSCGSSTGRAGARPESTALSRARLRHYTGTPPEHFQAYILFTNYHRYVDEFVRFAAAKLEASDAYEGLSCAGGAMIRRGTPAAGTAVSDSAWRRHQMPAYHL